MAQKKITDLELRSDFDETCNFPVDDTTQTFRVTGAQLNAFLKPNYNKVRDLLKNISIAASAGTGAMTVSLKQTDGSTNPTSAEPLVSEASFRSTTLTSGARAVVSFTAALSLVIPSGATLGFSDGDDARVFVYLYSDGTNKGLMVSSTLLPESRLYSLTSITTGADDNGYYADAARTNAAIRLIGEFSVDAITTAGTWTTPTYVSGFERTSAKKRDTSIATKTSADYTIADSDAVDTLLFSTSNSNRTATLPLAANNTNRKITIKKSDSGTGKVIIDGNGSETIDGATTLDLLVQYDFATLQCNGTAWFVISKRLATRWQKKNLAADQTTDAAMTDLSFTLEAGKTYRISPYFRTDVQDGAADPTVLVLIKDGSTEIMRLQITQLVSQQIIEQSKSFIYAMVGTALTFTTSSASANSYVMGGSDSSGGAKSFVVVEELRDHVAYASW